MRLVEATCQPHSLSSFPATALATILALGCNTGTQCPVAAPAPPTSERQAAAPEPAVGPDAPLPGQPRTVVRQVNHVVDFGQLSFEVDATDGGRIVAFSLGGRSIVVPRSESPAAYGSSIWPSPQRDWRWPPPPAFDQRAWNTQVEGRTLVLQSATDETLQLAAEQRLTADLDRELLRIDVILTNRGSAPRRVAPWQNTRVRPNGLTFYPSSRPAYDWSTLKLEPLNGIVWFQHDPAQHQESVKLLGDGREGWIAHVDGELILIKTFPDVPEARQAPDEGEVILYVDGKGTFVEVEQQGAYEELAPGASATWSLRWILRRLPPEIAVQPGNLELVEFVRGEVTAATR
jgi:hypothetical protein